MIVEFWMEGFSKRLLQQQKAVSDHFKKIPTVSA